MKKRIHNICKSCGKRIPRGLTKCLACSLNLKSRNEHGTFKCQVCGNAIGLKEEACSTCGTNFLELIEEEAGIKAQDSEEYMCMICNTTVEKKAVKCPVCGTVFIQDIDDYFGPVVEKVLDEGFGSKSVPRAS